DEDDRKKALFLKLVATEQMAYSSPEYSADRQSGMSQVVAILADAERYSWSVTALRSLAEKARSAGAEEAMVLFYRRLALADTENGARWQARLGEVALATQAYETAAFSFFSAYEATT